MCEFISDPKNVRKFLNEFKNSVTKICLEKVAVENEKDFDLNNIKINRNSKSLQEITNTFDLATLINRKAELYSRECESYNQKKNEKEEENYEPLSDVLIEVHFYQANQNKKTPALESGIQLRGSSPLTLLRDSFFCPRDHVSFRHFDQITQRNITMTTKEKFPSALLFIEGTFYNDLRSPESFEYSKEIISWAESRENEIGPFEVKDMSEVTLLDLDLKLGQPYLFLHQGCCEHFIVFSEMRILDSNDYTGISKYPIFSFKKKKKKIYCKGCVKNISQWVIRNCEICPEDPCILCTQCLLFLLPITNNITNTTTNTNNNLHDNIINNDNNSMNIITSNNKNTTATNNNDMDNCKNNNKNYENNCNDDNIEEIIMNNIKNIEEIMMNSDNNIKEIIMNCDIYNKDGSQVIIEPVPLFELPPY